MLTLPKPHVSACLALWLPHPKTPHYPSLLRLACTCHTFITRPKIKCHGDYVAWDGTSQLCGLEQITERLCVSTWLLTPPRDVVEINGVTFGVFRVCGSGWAVTKSLMTHLKQHPASIAGGCCTQRPNKAIRRRDRDTHTHSLRIPGPEPSISQGNKMSALPDAKGSRFFLRARRRPELLGAYSQVTQK